MRILSTIGSTHLYRTNFSCPSRFPLYIVHTVAFVSCVSLKKVDDDDDDVVMGLQNLILSRKEAGRLENFSKPRTAQTC